MRTPIASCAARKHQRGGRRASRRGNTPPVAEGDPDIDSLARRALEALNRDDWDAFVEFMHPEIEFRSLIAEADGETFRGHDGVRQWWDTVRGAFGSVTWEYQEIRAEGKHGVLRVRIEGTIRGVPVNQTMWQAVELRDGKAGWWTFFRSEQEAVQAVAARS